jgi:CheY-like chemotaxis protein
MISRKTILIVDDDADICFGHQVLLTANHYDTLFASDAVSAIREAHTHNPDLIILDLGLPSVPTSEYAEPDPEPAGGFLVMENLRADPDLSLIPVVVVSGRDPHPNRGRALGGGAMAFVQKPWNENQLLAIISQLLGSQQLSTFRT